MEHLTKPELLKKCKEFGIKYSGKNKSELIDLLEDHILEDSLKTNQVTNVETIETNETKKTIKFIG